MHLIAMACLENSLVVSVPFKGKDHSLPSWTLIIPRATRVLPAGPAPPAAVACHLHGRARIEESCDHRISLILPNLY